MRRKGGDLAPPPTPRKAYLNRSTENTSEPSQASKARQVFASQGLLAAPRTSKEQALQTLKRPITPTSIGLGRKTRRAKKSRRLTRTSR
jgi:hypothetical protein